MLTNHSSLNLTLGALIDSVDVPSTMVPLLLRLSFLVLATSLLGYKFNTIVPEPYLVSIA